MLSRLYAQKHSLSLATLFTVTPFRLLDAVKTVRSKALLVLSDVLSFQPGERIVDTLAETSGEAEELTDNKLASIKQASVS